MNVTWALYFVDVIHSLDTMIGLSWFLYFSALAISGVVGAVSASLDNSPDNLASKIFKILAKKWWAFALSVVVAVAIPDKNTMYLMLGTSMLSTSNIPSKVSEAIELKIDSVIKELKSHDPK